MGDLSEADKIYIRQLKLTMEYYQRLVYQINKVRLHFREPEKSRVEKVLGGKLAEDVKNEWPDPSPSQRRLVFRP